MKNRLKEALRKKEFVVTCEIIPGRGAAEPSQEKELREARSIGESGLVHAISITDNPGGNPALLADTVGVELAQSDITPLVHFTCKDRSRNQILAQLYALERRGLENVLIMTGDYPVGGWQGRSRPVFDLDPVQTLMLVNDMNTGLTQRTAQGEQQELPTHFFAGAVANPFKYTEGEVITQYAKIERKIFSGAEYLITQLGYDFRKLDELQRYVHELGSDIPLISNVFILSLGAARLMRKGVIAGCHVSDELYALLEEEAKADDKGKAARVERAAQMVAISKGMGFAGVHIGGLGVSAQTVAAVLERAEELQDTWQDLLQSHCFGEPEGFYYYEAADTVSEKHLNGKKMAERTEQVHDRRITRNYGISRFFHHMVLTRDKGLYGLLKRVMSRKEKKRGLHRHHGFEHVGKTILYGCMDCGDCGLETCIYSCPMTYCPKCQRNGPCGGSMNGWCEVYPEERYCIWFKAYHRLKKFGETQLLNRYITPPNNWDFYETSGWSNYTHERDNAAHRIPMHPEN